MQIGRGSQQTAGDLTLVELLSRFCCMLRGSFTIVDSGTTDGPVYALNTVLLSAQTRSRFSKCDHDGRLPLRRERNGHPTPWPTPTLSVLAKA